MNSEELLVEYKNLLATAVVTKNKQLLASIKQRISILEAWLASSKN